MPAPGMEPKARPASWTAQRAALNPQQANPDPAVAGAQLSSAPHHTTTAANGTTFMRAVMEDQLDLFLETVEPEDRF